MALLVQVVLEPEEMLYYHLIMVSAIWVYFTEVVSSAAGMYFYTPQQTDHLFFLLLYYSNSLSESITANTILLRYWFALTIGLVGSMCIADKTIYVRA